MSIFSSFSKWFLLSAVAGTLWVSEPMSAEMPSAQLTQEKHALTARDYRVKTYPSTPEAEIDSELWFTASGRYVPLEMERSQRPDRPEVLEHSRARFAAEGLVAGVVVLRDHKAEHAYLRVPGRNLPVFRLGSVVTFLLPGPGLYHLRVADGDWERDVSIHVDNLNEPGVKLRDPSVINVGNLGIYSDPTLLRTTDLQAILKGCEGMPTGCTVYFPPGIYRSGTLMVPSNTTLYLAPGALLKGSDNPADFSAGTFLWAKDATNVAFRGYGVIDANGSSVPPSGSNEVVLLDGCSDALLENLTFRNSADWAIEFRQSSSIRVRGVEVLSHRDGIDPVSSNDVIIENAFIRSIDDSIAVKTVQTPPRQGSKRITVKDSFVSTVASALKIGTETYASITDVKFDTVDVYDTDRGVALYADEGGEINRITWRNIRMDFKDYPSEDRSGTAFHLRIRNDGGIVTNILIENVEATVFFNSEFRGLAEFPIKPDDVKMKNITLNVQPPHRNAEYLFICNEFATVGVQGLRINWNGNESAWLGVDQGGCLQIRPPSRT